MAQSEDLGLEYGRVVVTAHRPGWAQAFVDERAHLQKALGSDSTIEHLGSTSVPGLVAKPILDIGVLTAAPHQFVVVELERIGYIFRGDKGDAGGLLFVRESEPRVRTHHVHLVRPGDGQWYSWLRFRDLLISDPGLRMTYDEEKRELAARFAEDRRSYTAAKTAVIRRILTESQPRIH